MQIKLRSMRNSLLHTIPLATIMCQRGFMKFIGHLRYEHSFSLSICPIALINEHNHLGRTLTCLTCGIVSPDW